MGFAEGESVVTPVEREESLQAIQALPEAEQRSLKDELLKRFAENDKRDLERQYERDKRQKQREARLAEMEEDRRKIHPDVLAAINRYRRYLSFIACADEFDDAKFREYVKRIKTLCCCLEVATSAYQIDRMVGYMKAVEPLVPGVRVGVTKAENAGAEAAEPIDPALAQASAELMKQKAS